MKRREFLTALGAAALGCPLATRAQPPRMPTIGFLSSASPGGLKFYVTAFRRGLKDAGYFEGWNIAVEYLWAEGRIDRLPALTADLIKRQVAVIFADTQAALAAKAVTTTIPIVFCCAGDPLALGLVRNLDRPGGNITGVSFPVVANAIKRMQMLRALVPKAAAIGYLRDADNALAGKNETNEVTAAAHAFGMKFEAVDAGGASDLGSAFAAFVRHGADAIVVGGDPQFISVRDSIVALAARHRIPALYNLRPWAISGGLMSYGPNIENAVRQCGVYAAHILKGASAGEQLVGRSSKIELVINLKAAKTLRLTVPQPLLLAADEVIE
jgi:putative tryptophan/tyrosine transport system substrate-binding protein